jgi:hypothetical protein
MSRRYTEPTFQRVYDTLTRLAYDSQSELYRSPTVELKGPRRGASPRCAFWDGFDGITPAYIARRTMGAVCLQAGRDFRRAVESKRGRK